MTNTSQNYKTILKFLCRELGAKTTNVRDSLMGANMKYLYEQRYKGRKIIGWGANLHFANDLSKIEASDPSSKKVHPMGYHLKKALGDRVFILAVTTDNNYPGTIERAIGEKKVDIAWMTGATLNNQFSTSLLAKPALGNWANTVDAIIYFNSSVSEDDPGADLFIKGRIINAKDKAPISFASMSLEGTTTGTATSMDGEFMMKVDSPQLSKRIKISSIGYKTRYVTVKSLLNGRTFSLEPELKLLQEVVVVGRMPDGREILRNVIEHLSDNYNQTPFNMEFHSVITTEDTISQASFTTETIFESYYDGYYREGKKNYRLTQKRESENYFMKTKTQGLTQWPMWEVAYNDIFSNQTEYQVVTSDDFDKIDPKLKGIEFYDGDTVFVVQYKYQVDGTLYISAKDYAVLRHVTTDESKKAINRMEISYKNIDGKYYPYSATGEHIFPYKVKGSKSFVKITNRTNLTNISLTKVSRFEFDQDLWFPKNVAFNKEYWDANYPGTISDRE